MKGLKVIGLVIFILGLLVFTFSMFSSQHELNPSLIKSYVPSESHQAALIKSLGAQSLKSSSNFEFVSQLQALMSQARDNGEKIEPWQEKNYLTALTKASTQGPLYGRSKLALWLSIILAAFGALLSFLPDLKLLPGIKNNGIYHSSATRGLNLYTRYFLLGAVVLTIILYALGQSMLLILSLLVSLGLIAFFVIRSEKNHNGSKARSASVSPIAWIGMITGAYLICFYILLYFFPYYITNWMKMLDPVSQSLSGYPASEWFVYGFLYCVVMVVMGIRMLIKYRHNKYQLLRTLSVIFFQLCFAFLLPEIMLRLNQPYMDFKNAWPLDYDFFTKDELNKLVGQGSEVALAGFTSNIGTMMLIWGIVFALIIVPLLTYFFGKRWYCSWVCGCGGLAETLGDPYRQLSDKSLRAWKIERYVIHGVAVFAILMTGVVLYQYLTGNDQILFLNAYSVKSWYGFMIGAMFSGIVGTGFYPLMGNRMWCRYGCPLTALMGIVQRFKSRFRITTNGGQCISCGNCSTYCEMGIDVRAYAQKGQNIVRASCVGCGICSAVCPRGVLKLENGTVDIGHRTTDLKAIHISENDISLL